MKKDRVRLPKTEKRSEQRRATHERRVTKKHKKLTKRVEGLLLKLKLPSDYLDHRCGEDQTIGTIHRRLRRWARSRGVVGILLSRQPKTVKDHPTKEDFLPENPIISDNNSL